jgi:glutamine amidotransferase
VIRLAVVDHGAGNLVSIAQGLERAGASVVVADSPAGLHGARGVVLPGVGATGAAMRRLEGAGFAGPLRDWRGPLLGICVGLQLFFEESEEDGGACLGLLEGRVEQLRSAPRLPHIGWNDLTHHRPDSLFRGIPSDATFYFVHSYAAVPADGSRIVAESEYGAPFVAAVRAGNRVGVQFHPERSGPSGLQVLGNFVAECEEAADAA